MNTAVTWPVLRNYIGNEFVEPLWREQSLVNPSDGAVLGQQAGSTNEAIQAALRCAEACHKSGDWFSLGKGRADVLMKIADQVSLHVDELALLEALSSGVILRQTKSLIGLLPLIFRAAAAQLLQHPDCEKLGTSQAIQVWRKPWGPALCLAPWNSPAPIGAHKLASALAAGAPAILKPSEFTPFTSQRLFEIIASCGLPRGAAQLVHGAGLEGATLAADRRIKAVSFTGGLKSGQAVGQICMQQLKPVQLELGGHNPFIILPDADLKRVIDGLVAGLTTLNGQWCRAIGRIFVPTAMKATVIDAFLHRVESLRITAATDPAADMGPLVSRQHLDHVHATIGRLESLGAKRHRSTTVLPGAGTFFAPELLSELSLEADDTEIFGPVAVVHSYDDVQGLSDRVNDTKFGLAAYIYGSDEGLMYKLAQSLDVGSTKLNGVTMTSLSPNAPRAAWGVSGLGEEGAFETFRFFQGSSVIGKVSQ